MAYNFRKNKELFKVSKFSSLVFIASAVGSRLYGSFLSRKSEYKADEVGVKLIGDKKPLISLYKNFIIYENKLQNYIGTHPACADRINNINKISPD